MNIITPSCLRVDKAIIFFISHSAMALAPAISIVRLENNISMLKNCGHLLIIG